MRTCARLHAVLSGTFSPLDGHTTLEGVRLGIVRNVMNEDLDAKVAADFDRVCTQLNRAGARLLDIGLSEAGEAGAINKTIVACEAMQIHKDHLTTLEDVGDPQVLKRILGARDYTSNDLRDARRARENAISAFAKSATDLAAFIAPTVPMIAPTVEETQMQFDRINGLMLRNPSIVNFFDGCAASLPMNEPGHLGTGLMIFGPRGRDWAILELAGIIEMLLKS